MFLYRILLISLVLCSCSASDSHAANRAETAIRGVLQAQETAWNRGDLPAFMAGYWADDSLVFIGCKGPVYGYATTLANYLRSYPDTVQMGKFTSSVLQLRRLGRRHYMVIGSWQLHRSVGDIGGYYTLLFRKIRGRWLIIQDHTS